MHGQKGHSVTQESCHFFSFALSPGTPLGLPVLVIAVNVNCVLFLAAMRCQPLKGL